MLGNGQGKQRMTRSIGTRKKLTWRLLFVSAGEVTLAEHAASVGKRTRGGAEVRLLNIDADAGAGMGLFENLHGAASPDIFAHELKNAGLRFYGVPFREFLQLLVQNTESIRKLILGAQNAIQECVPPDAPGEVRRAAERFGVIGAAGELATKWGLTGWAKNEAIDVMKRVCGEWLQNRGTSGASDAETGVRQVRSFIQTHPSRFENVEAVGLNDKSLPIRERAGFVRFNRNTRKAQEYLVFPEVFRRELCAGCSHRLVLKELEARGYLKRTPPDMTEKPYIRVLGRSLRMYCIRAAILEGDE